MYPFVTNRVFGSCAKEDVAATGEGELERSQAPRIPYLESRIAYRESPNRSPGSFTIYRPSPPA
jgi:hypothetical protein